MIIDTANLVSLSEANQNFSKVARLVDKNGSVVILKNNVPRYIMMEFSAAENLSNEDISLVTKKIIEENIAALRELVK